MGRKKNRKIESAPVVDEVIVDVIEEDDYKEPFLDKYQNHLMIGVAVILLLIAGYFAYKYLILAPKEKEAVEEMAQAQYRFGQDSFALALENPGEGYLGFLGIIDEYSGTKAANLSKYYAGVSYLNMGMYEEAIKYLKGYNEDELLTNITKYGALGDAYSELNDLDNAKSYYKKAVSQKPNDLLTPFYLKKLGMLYRAESNAKEANMYFDRLKNDFPKSVLAQDIDKFKMVAAK